MRNNFFLTVKELLQLVEKNSWQIIIWGTGIPAHDVFRTLCGAGIEIHAWGDNNPVKQGEILHGKPVVGPRKLHDKDNLIVIIACWMSFGSILTSLEKDGFKNVYGLIDSLKYDLKEIEHDENFLGTIEVPKEKDKILLEIYGNIGDVLIHLGIMFHLLQKYCDTAYILAEGEALSDVIGILTANVFVIDRQRFFADLKYRRNILATLFSIGFRKSIVLSDARITSTRRILNDRIFPVEELVYARNLPLGDYLPIMDAKGLEPEHIPLSAVAECSFFRDKISETKIIYNLPKKYVAVNMGTSSPVRRYSPLKFSKVITHIIKKGYAVIFLGAGAYDERFFAEVLHRLPRHSPVQSFISCLSLRESLYIIYKSAFFVGTESGMWNASCLLRVPSVVIYGRGDYGSFMHEAGYIRYVNTPDMGCTGCCWFCTNRNDEGEPRCIAEITPEMIISGIDELAVRMNK